ncbi:hypothetical protein NDU88_003200 [Pleurodeles waltl]|uniref:Uncharacterized protein n=1 Tax=Pleurodeles waltl TaxID=8319 RepID=A0AAV7SCR8_PLEWA|nr:hypothetical protein NDU88_003200 [Pleurodeles waltl]
MAYNANEDEQYQELQEMPLEHQMEERLVEALGHHVQDSVNWALIQALKPFTQPLTNFAKREFLGESSQQHRLQTGEPKEASGLSLQRSGGSSSADILPQMAASVLRDHAYGGFTHPHDASSSFQQTSFSQPSSQDPSSSKSESDDSQTDSLPRKKQRKSRHSMSEVNSPAGKNLLFSPEDIIHPRSTEWVPTAEVAHYVQDRLRKSFEKEVRNTLSRLDPKLAELATNEAGSSANGMLFGDKLISNWSKYVATFTALDKAESNIKKVFNNAFFARAGCFRG